MEKKILVVFYSKTGTTERVGRDIAARLNADVESIVDMKGRKGLFGFLFGGRDAMRRRKTAIAAPKFNPEKYDLVIIGTPVWAWGMTPAVRAYIEQTRAWLKNIAFFATSGSSALDKTLRDMEVLAGKNAAASAGFTSADLRSKATYSKKIDTLIHAVIGVQNGPQVTTNNVL